MYSFVSVSVCIPPDFLKVCVLAIFWLLRSVVVKWQLIRTVAMHSASELENQSQFLQDNDDLSSVIPVIHIYSI